MSGPTVTEQRQRIVRLCRGRGLPWPASMRQVAAWALDEGLWEPARGTMVGQLAEELARAMREEFYTDPQGREVRTKHAARIIAGGSRRPYGMIYGLVTLATSKSHSSSAGSRLSEIAGS